MKLKKKIKFPLMRNNILRCDLNEIIRYLKKQDPILTNGKKVREFEEKLVKMAWCKIQCFLLIRDLQLIYYP